MGYNRQMEILVNDLSPRQLADLHQQIEAEFVVRVLNLQSRMATLSALDPSPQRSETLSDLPGRTQELVKLVGGIEQDNPLVHCRFVNKIKAISPGFKLEWNCGESTDLGGISLAFIIFKGLHSTFGSLATFDFHRRSGGVALFNKLTEGDYSKRTRAAIPTMLDWIKHEMRYQQLEVLTELAGFISSPN